MANRSIEATTISDGSEVTRSSRPVSASPGFSSPSRTASRRALATTTRVDAIVIFVADPITWVHGRSPNLILAQVSSAASGTISSALGGTEIGTDGWSMVILVRTNSWPSASKPATWTACDRAESDRLVRTTRPPVTARVSRPAVRSQPSAQAARSTAPALVHAAIRSAKVALPYAWVWKCCRRPSKNTWSPR